MGDAKWVQKGTEVELYFATRYDCKVEWTVPHAKTDNLGWKMMNVFSSGIKVTGEYTVGMVLVRGGSGNGMLILSRLCIRGPKLILSRRYTDVRPKEHG